MPDPTTVPSIDDVNSTIDNLYLQGATDDEVDAYLQTGQEPDFSTPGDEPAYDEDLFNAEIDKRIAQGATDDELDQYIQSVESGERTLFDPNAEKPEFLEYVPEELQDQAFRKFQEQGVEGVITMLRSSAAAEDQAQLALEEIPWLGGAFDKADQANMIDAWDNFVNQSKQTIPNIEFTSSRIARSIFGDDSIVDLSEGEEDSLDAIRVLQAQSKGAGEIIGGVQDGDISGTIATILTSPLSLAGTLVNTAPVALAGAVVGAGIAATGGIAGGVLAGAAAGASAGAGVGIFPSMFPSTYLSVNEDKAERLGITVEELVASGQDSVAGPVAFTAAASALEFAGLKGVGKYLTSSAAPGFRQEAIRFLLANNKEGITEYLQTGLESAAVEWDASDGSIEKTATKFIEALGTQEAFESYALGFFASGTVGSIKPIRSAVSSIRTPEEVEAVKENAGKQAEIKEQLAEPSNTPEQTAALETALAETYQEGQEIVEEAPRKIVHSNEVEMDRLEEISNEITKNDSTLSIIEADLKMDPDLKENLIKTLDARSARLRQEGLEIGQNGYARVEQERAQEIDDIKKADKVIKEQEKIDQKREKLAQKEKAHAAAPEPNPAATQQIKADRKELNEQSKQLELDFEALNEGALEAVQNNPNVDQVIAQKEEEHAVDEQSAQSQPIEYLGRKFAKIEDTERGDAKIKLETPEDLAEAKADFESRVIDSGLAEKIGDNVFATGKQRDAFNVQGSANKRGLNARVEKDPSGDYIIKITDPVVREQTVTDKKREARKEEERNEALQRAEGQTLEQALDNYKKAKADRDARSETAGQIEIDRLNKRVDKAKAVVDTFKKPVKPREKAAPIVEDKATKSNGFDSLVFEGLNDLVNESLETIQDRKKKFDLKNDPTVALKAEKKVEKTKKKVDEEVYQNVLEEIQAIQEEVSKKTGKTQIKGVFDKLDPEAVAQAVAAALQRSQDGTFIGGIISQIGSELVPSPVEGQTPADHKKLQARVGYAGLDVLIQNGVLDLKLTKDKNEKHPSLKIEIVDEHAGQYLDDFIRGAGLTSDRHPWAKVFTSKPKPFTEGTHETGLPLIANGTKKQLKTVDGKVLDTVNELIETPLRVNAPLLNIFQQVKDSSKILNFRKGKDKITRKDSEAIRAKERERDFVLDTASGLGADPFYQLYKLDYRGRIYSTSPYFNHQGSALSKSLFLFDKAKPIGATGWSRLLINAADTSGDNAGMTFNERFKYANEKLDDWMEIAADPVKHLSKWEDLNEPESFLATILEIRAALQNPEGVTKYKSAFPIHQDATTSGAQILTALLRDGKSAESVNLTNSETRQDLYLEVANKIWKDIKPIDAKKDKAAIKKMEKVSSEMEDLNVSMQKALAIEDTAKRTKAVEKASEKIKKWHKENDARKKAAAATFWGNPKIIKQMRKIVKGPVMTKYYSAGAPVMAEDLYKKFKDNPDFKGINNTYTFWLAVQLHESAGKVLPGPSKLMGRLQSWGAELARDNKQIKFTTPVNNFFFEQNYVKREEVKLQLPYNGKNLKQNVIQPNLRIGEVEIDAGKIKSATAPNFVHSLDSQIPAHLVLNTNYDVMTIHDSFATTPGDTQGLYKDVRQGFVDIFEGNQLENLLKENFSPERATELYQELVDEGLIGNLDLSEVLDNQYNFSAGTAQTAADLTQSQAQKVEEQFDAHKKVADKMGVQVTPQVPIEQTKKQLLEAASKRNNNEYSLGFNPLDKASKEYVGEIAKVLGEAWPEINLAITPQAWNNAISDLNSPFVNAKGVWIPGKNTVALNPGTVTKDTAIHEFGHIWASGLLIKNPELWKRGRDLLKGSDFVKVIYNNPNYRAYLKNEPARFWEEVMAYAIGKTGAKIFEGSKEKASLWDKYVGKVQSWVKSQFGISQSKNFNDLTLESWLDLAAKDVLTGGQLSQQSAVATAEYSLELDDPVVLANEVLSNLTNKESDSIGDIGVKRARTLGRKAKTRVGKSKFNVLSSSVLSTNIYGIFDKMVAKTKEGQKQLDKLKEIFIDPVDGVDHNLKSLNMDAGKKLSEIVSKKELKKLARTKSIGDFSQDDAIQVYLMNKKEGNLENSGLSDKEVQDLVSYIEAAPELKAVADKVFDITGDGWVDQIDNWDHFDIAGALQNYYRSGKREAMLADNGWFNNVENTFNETYYNKVRATVTNGEDVVKALKGALSSMHTGKTFDNEGPFTRKLVGISSAFNALPIGGNIAIGVKQTASFLNFIQVSGPNNLANYLKSFTSGDMAETMGDIFKSDWAQERLGAKSFDVDFSDFAEGGKVSPTKLGQIAKALRRGAIDVGFLPVSIGDLTAIVFGGASYIINHKKALLKEINPSTTELYTPGEAKAEAMRLMIENAEASQQSKLASQLSYEQRSVIGKLVLPFKTFQQQAVRKSEQAFNALKRDGDGDWKNASFDDKKKALGNILFYRFASPAIFSLMTDAILTSITGGDEDDDMLAGTARSIAEFNLVGQGKWGALAVVAGKIVEEIYDQLEKGEPNSGKFLKAAVQALPGASIATRKLSALEWELRNDDVSAIELAGLSTELAFQVPTMNWINYIEAQSYQAKDNVSLMEKAHIALGWKPWQLGLKEEGKKKKSGSRSRATRGGHSRKRDNSR